MVKIKLWWWGFFLAMVTSVSWGFQSVAMSVIVRELPPLIVAFVKMSFSFVVIGIILAASQRSQFHRIIVSTRPQAILTAGIASISLAASYGLFAWAFTYLSPANVQLYMQTERFILALCGIFVFKESFKKSQWIGLWIVPIGYYLFFCDQISHTSSTARYYRGVALVLGTAVTWVIYALCQKRLLSYMTSQVSLLIIFFFSSLLLLPFADLQTLFSLSGSDSLVLGLICFSSALAFACFAEALYHWDISRIGAVISTTPLVAISLTAIATTLFPTVVVPEQINAIGMIGAIIIVLGSAMGSLSNSK